MSKNKTIDSLKPSKYNPLIDISNTLIMIFIIFIFTLIIIYTKKDSIFQKNITGNDKEDPIDLNKALTGSLIITIIILFIIWVVRGTGCHKKNY